MNLEEKHSRLGIASLCVLLGGLTLAPVMFIAGMIVAAPHSGGFPALGAVLIRGGVILGCCSVLVALGLGVAGLCQTGRKRLFAILGTAVSGIIAVIILTLAVQFFKTVAG